jgi:2-dehydropantoate 2-reductase
LRALACAVADPFRAWAKALGHDLPSNDWLIDLCLDAGDFPTSMLQDARAGRRLELDAIARAPRDLGIAAGMPTPTLDAIIAALNTAPSLPLPQDHRAAARRALLESICFERT